MRTKASLHLFALTLAASASVVVFSGCPPTPTCPSCTLKKAKYTVKKYRELDLGYTITAAQLSHRVDYESHCPKPPSGDSPPCQRADSRSVMPAVEGEEYDEDLMFKTDESLGDSETATVTFTLTKSGSPTLTKTQTPTIYEP